MLKNLSIKNYALIEDISVDFNGGLTVITGETGAGKSIIIQTVDLLLGARASSSSIRKGADSCSLAAVFAVSRNKPVKRILDDTGIDFKDEIIIRRIFDVSGKSKSFINDIPVSLSVLSETGKFLVDFYAQNKSNMLFDGGFQRQILDDMAGNGKELEKLGKLYSELTKLQNRKNALELSLSEREKMTDLYNFQLNEINSAALVPGEDLQTEAELPKLKNAEKIKNISGEILNNLYKQNNSALDCISKTIKQIDSLASLGVDSANLSKTLNDVFIQTDDVYREINAIYENADIDPRRLNEMLERQQLIKKLKSKYGGSIEEVLKYKNELEEKIKNLTEAGFNIEAVEKEITRLKKEAEAAGEELSLKRKTVSKKLAKTVSSELEELNLKNAHFEITVTKQEMTQHGFDKIEFMFCANPGEPAYPLAEAASGGEISRVMLAIAAALSEHYKIPTVIFDEIDTGTSGQTSQKIGRKLKKASAQKQIISVSHQAQIASNADTHISIYKEISGKRNVTKARILTHEEHIEEIAKIISGEKITEHALKHAKEMTLQ